MLHRQSTPQADSTPSSRTKNRHIYMRTALCFCAVIGLTSLSGCTTYTWPDGSQKTVIGVPAADENSRYEEDTDTGTRYRVPGEVPPKKDIQK